MHSIPACNSDYTRHLRPELGAKLKHLGLGRNYTLDENPGMGAEGAYYYHLTAKALSAGREGTDCTRWRNNQLARGTHSQPDRTAATRPLMANPHQALNGRRPQAERRLCDNGLGLGGRQAVDPLR